jgi:hypothetical protein
MSSAIALISDIHGNLPALRAVVEDARLQGVNRFLNLGDILYGPLWPRETFELLQTLDLAHRVSADRVRPFALSTLPAPARRPHSGEPGQRRPARVLVGSAPAAPHGNRLAKRL